MKLITEAELAADILRIDAAKAAELRRVKKWPHVRLGRFDVRYTEAQVEEIVRMQSAAPKAPAAAPVTAQTKGSARRSA